MPLLPMLGVDHQGEACARDVMVQRGDTRLGLDGPGAEPVNLCGLADDLFVLSFRSRPELALLLIDALHSLLQSSEIPGHAFKAGADAFGVARPFPPPFPLEGAQDARSHQQRATPSLERHLGSIAKPARLAGKSGRRWKIGMWSNLRIYEFTNLRIAALRH